MPHSFVRAVIVIRNDGIVGEWGVGAHYKNKGNVGVFDHLLHGRAEAFGSFCEQDTVNSFGKQQLDCTLFLFENVVAVAKQQIVAVLLRSIISAADDQRKERIAYVRYDHADRVCSPVCKAPRDKIRTVVEFANRGLHTLTKTLADVSFLVYNRRHGEYGHTGFAGNVINAGCLPGLFSCLLVRRSPDSSVTYGNHLLLS